MTVLEDTSAADSWDAYHGTVVSRGGYPMLHHICVLTGRTTHLEEGHGALHDLTGCWRLGDAAGSEPVYHPGPFSSNNIAGTLPGVRPSIASSTTRWPFCRPLPALDPGQRTLGRVTRFEAEPGPRPALHTAMIWFEALMPRLHLPDAAGGPVFLIVALDGGFIGRTPVDRDLLRHAATADRFL